MSKTTMTAQQANYFKNNPKEKELFFLSNGLCVRTKDAADNQAAKLQKKSGKAEDGEVVSFTREEYEAYVSGEKEQTAGAEGGEQNPKGSAAEQALVAATEKLDAARAALKAAQDKQAALAADAHTNTKRAAEKKVADCEAAVAAAETEWNAAKDAVEPAGEGQA